MVTAFTFMELNRIMKIKILRILYWIAFALTILFFYMGLRAREQALKFTIIALACWGITFAINRLMKAK